MKVFRERNREVSRERSKKNDFRIAKRPYIEQLVNLDRCRYRKVSRDLSRRCRENARRQLRCREGIKEQHIRIKNRSSIDPPGVKKLSRRQEFSRSIHQISRRCQDCVTKKGLRSSTDSKVSRRCRASFSKQFFERRKTQI